ncbi:MAG: hypothetical protein WC011_01565 [Candidatus Paceibacterota bacterium]
MGKLITSLHGLVEGQIIKSTVKYEDSFVFFKVRSILAKDSELISLILIKFYPEVGEHTVTLPIESKNGQYVSSRDSSFDYKFYESSYEEFIKDFTKALQKIHEEQMKLISFIVTSVILEKEIVEFA